MHQTDYPVNCYNLTTRGIHRNPLPRILNSPLVVLGKFQATSELTTFLPCILKWNIMEGIVDVLQAVMSFAAALLQPELKPLSKNIPCFPAFC